MKLLRAFTTLTLTGAAILLYGALVEVDKLTLERRDLRLRRWPRAKNGFKIGFVADLHLRDSQTIELTKRAIWTLIEESVDIVVIGGDFVSSWREDSPWILGEALEALVGMDCPVIGVPGNRDYYGGDASYLEPILNELGIQLLRNECTSLLGINWVGIDSANEHKSDLVSAFGGVRPDQPTIVLWHEPDVVDQLPPGDAVLMLSGHSHGGQFTTPWGWAPVTTVNGRIYMRGYYPDAPTPLYVSRGLGTTGPPSRLFCRPEVTVLTLFSDD